MKANCRRTPSGSAKTKAATSSKSRLQKAEEVLERARLLELPARIVGRTLAPADAGGDAISLKGEKPLLLAELRAAHEGWMKGLMG